MNKSALLALLCSLFLLQSCAQVPESVVEEIDHYNSITQQTNTGKEGLRDFEEIIFETDVNLVDYGQFLLDGIVAKLPSHDAMPHNFELNIRGCPANDDLRRIAENQFPEINLDAYSAGDTQTVFYDDENSSFYCDGSRMIRTEGYDGSIRLLHGASLNYCDYSNSADFSAFGINALSVWEPSQFFPSEKIISLHNGEKISSGLAFPLSDGTVRVNDALHTAEEYLNAEFAQFEDNTFTYKVRKIYIRKVSENIYGYEFVAERLYDGIPIDSTPLYNFEGADFGAEDYYVENGDSIYVWMVEPLMIDYFYCSGRRTVSNVSSGYEKIITLETAIDKTVSTLTQTVVFDCMSVELLYMNGYYADTYLNRITEADTIKFAEYPRNTRLVWAILVETPRIVPGTLEHPHDPHYSFFVDASTGEVFGFYDQTADYIY